MLALKLTLTPILIAAATLAARRWGPVVGGTLTGLPLTSGPVSVFLLLEQGREFTAIAARGSVIGLVGVAAFCVSYAHAAGRFGPVGCLAIGFAAYLPATALMRWLDPGLFLGALLVAAALGAALVAIPIHALPEREPPPPPWDIPARMVAATGMVLAITAAAATLGATWTGLLSPFPVFSSVLAAFAHLQSGPHAATRLQRGLVAGVFSFAAFFIVVSLLVEQKGAVATYAIASGVAIAVNAVGLVLLSRRERMMS